MKIKILAVMLACFSQLQTLAHAGHDHGETPAEYLASVKAHQGDTYAINGADGHLGHFVIKSVKGQAGNIALRLEQTFHLDPDLTETVKATLSLEKILEYKFVAGDETYLLVIDFQDMDSGSNTGYRISYSTQHDGRTISSEAITLEKASE